MIGQRKQSSYGTPYSDEETRVFEQEVLPEFETAYPNIQIESVRQAYNNEYQAALMARASADKTPDVIRMDFMWVAKFAQSGLLHPLDQFDDFEAVSLQLNERLLKSNRYDGRLYGLPLNINTKAAIYNTMLLKEAGISETPKTLPEVIEVARENKYVIGMSGIEMWSSLPYFFGLGGKLANENFTKTEGYFNSDESIQAMETLVNLFNEGIINPHMLTNGGDLWNNVYSSWNMLMIDEGPWYYSVLMNSTSLNVDLLKATHPEPFPFNGEYRSMIGGESLVMTKGTNDKKEAWTFIQWMMRRETQSAMFNGGLIPTNMEAFQGNTSVGTVNRYIEPYIEGIEDGYYRPPLPRWNEIENIYTDTLEDVFLGGTNVKDALDEASILMDKVLNNK
jgi:multiple sugar transport system substrate-binding protein